VDVINRSGEISRDVFEVSADTSISISVGHFLQQENEECLPEGN
jgi:prophage maintenance system killer protein